MDKYTVEFIEDVKKIVVRNLDGAFIENNILYSPEADANIKQHAEDVYTITFLGAGKHSRRCSNLYEVATRLLQQAYFLGNLE